ncbi:glycosyltransferase family 39 protein [Candidatus Woesebacteria bacterium]|nr:MAG: glycosyltransferase family 39 protein [Candidatus Woesebacteria bacterium]
MTTSTNKSIFPYILLSVIVFLALIVRLYKIDTPLADWHSWRQTDTASVSRLFDQQGINLFVPKYQDISNIQTGFDNPNGYRFVEFPLFNVIHALVYRYTDLDFVVAGRLVSIVASLISTIFIYLIGKRCISITGGILSAIFFAFIPFNIFYSRVILPEPLAIMFGLGALYCFYRFTDSNSIMWIIYSGLLLALSILVKPFTSFYTVPMLYLLFKDKNIKKTFTKLLADRRMWMFVLLTFTPFVLWRIWISEYPEGIPHMKWAFNSDGIRFKPSFFRWIFKERIGTLILGVWGVVPFVFGIINYEKDNRVINWFLLGVITFTTIFATASVRHDYYQIILLPAISLSLSVGCISLWNYLAGIRKIVARCVVMFCIIMLFVMGWFEVRGFYQINNFSIVKAGIAVDKLTPPDSLVVAPYNKDSAFLYQTNRSGWPYLTHDIDLLIEKGADYYVSVNFDQTTLDVMEKFDVIEKTNEYVIVKLH